MAALDGATYRHSFGGLGFFFLGTPGRTLPRRGRTARYQRDPIPYGNAAVLQHSGYDDAPLQRQVVIRASEVNAWRAAVGTARTLSVAGDSAVSAYLASFATIEGYPDGTAAVTAAVEWVF